VLYCIALYCTVLYYAVLYCAVLYCTVLYCAVLYCDVLCCTVLYCTLLYCIVLYCIVLCCTVLCCIVLCCIVLCCTVLYCAVLYCTMLCCDVLLLLCSFSHKYMLTLRYIKPSYQQQTNIQQTEQSAQLNTKTNSLLSLLMLAHLPEKHQSVTVMISTFRKCIVLHVRLSSSPARSGRPTAQHPRRPSEL
jgi:hypothetical protein